MENLSTIRLAELFRVREQSSWSNITSLDIALTVVSAALLLLFITRKRTTAPVSTQVKTADSTIEDHSLFEKSNYSDVKVTKILIHPIKSCKGTSVAEARYNEEGLQNDRKLAIIDAVTHTVITAREKPNMVLIHPQVLEDPSDPDGGCLLISFPGDGEYETLSIPLSPSHETLKKWTRLEDIKLWGREDIDGYICQSAECDSTDPDKPTRILTRFFGRDVYLVYKGPRPRPCPSTYAFPDLKASALYQDGYPLLVASEESLSAVKERLKKEVGKSGVAVRWEEDDLVMERFRPNIVFAGAGVPWAEDVWENIRIGQNDSSICLVSKCARCLLPNVDPETGVRDAAVPYKVLMKFRTGRDPARLSKPCFGCNGVPSGAGVVRVGDLVEVLTFVPLV